ncbi:unnamed protein product [Paramecium pentaurelia]|uniref:ABC transporter family protein n=1 Tax=Paramecium pentaurelia TaxID=43138 RepID=A0A8S1SVM1_9CILI|nr:unnamed protein product [Paramecium pentaurelia]
MSESSPEKKQEELEMTSQQKDNGTNNQILTVLNDQQEEAQQEQQPLNMQDGQDEPSMLTIPEEEEDKFYPYYHGEKSWIISKFFFLHLTEYSLFLKRNVLDKGHKILEKHLPKLSPWEDLKESVEVSQKTVKQKKKISCGDLVKIIFFGQLKWISLGCFFSYSLEALVRNGVSIVMSKVITSAANNEKDNAYGFATLLVFLNLLCVFTRHHGYNLAMIFSSKARMTLINLVYIKLTELSAYSIKEANIGKILNLVSGDINYLEFVLIMIFQSSVCFISMIFGCYILWDRFSGPIGMIALAIIFVAYPIQILLQSFNSETLKTSKQYQDQRLKLTNELIEGVRLIKMYAWELAFNKMISIMRQKEYICLLKISFRSAIDRLFSLISQVWSSFIFFVILYYGGFRQTMTVAEMISTIQLLTFFKISCVFMVSYGIQSVIHIKVSFTRIATILNIENSEMTSLDKILLKSDNNTQSKEYNGPRIQLKNFTSFWISKVTETTKPVLKNLTLDIQAGEAWAFIGRVGCGKSTLLSAFLHEIPAYKGSFKIDGQEANKGVLTIAYVEQEPFIFPDTIKRNILFGRTYDKVLYQKVLHASQLEADLSLMKFQDHTEIGERGTTLSGGQKARLSLARALYQQADLYLFDDPLSAVDASVAKNIFHMAIKEFIFDYQIQRNPSKKKPIVILVTHQVQYAVECDKIAILNDGELIAQGSYEDIKSNLYMINEELAQQLNNTKESKKQEFIRPQFQKRIKMRNSVANNLIGKEADQQSLITLKTYFRYYKFWNLIIILCVLSLEAGSEVLNNFYQRIISLFEEYQQENDIDTAYFLLGMLTLGLFLSNFMKYALNTYSVQTSTQKIHQQMLKSLTLAPVSYFDVNPSGRIINRFSNDLSLCDNQTNSVSLDVLEIIGGFIFALITLAILQPYFLIMIVFIITVDIYQFSYAKKIISQLKEVELMQRSPLFDFLKKTLGGVIQVRVYEQQAWFREQFLEISNKCNLNALTYYYSSRSFGFNLDLVGFIAQTVGIFIFVKLNYDDVAILSQGLLLLTTYNDALQWGLRQLITFETQMNSYNRMFQIIDILPESPHVKEEDSKYPDFPKDGRVKFQNVFMRYRQNCDLVLKGLSFDIQSGQKIGCVGRTGAGKSSILQAIFRMSEIENDKESKLLISDLDVRKLGLHKLRSNIGIIPQSPFLFTGTIRRNLDPFDNFTDEQLWKALEQTDLINHVKAFQNGLLTDMSDVNSVFSVGQKQLICLARIILFQKKIIVLDEATANVDMKTDDFIQETLKKKFTDCTLITIAHRLNTIADYDKVMVVSEGQVIEFDTPFNLLANSINSTYVDKNTEFSRLVKNTGDQNAQAIFDIAKQKHIKI